MCHEQTDVRINPGLREFFGFGHSQPDSVSARQWADSFRKPFLKPGTPPGAWTHIVHSQRLLGGAIWAAFDEPFFFPDGTRAGYAWHHGFWGILDGWRRPKPEWWLTKLIFSPVWFPNREVTYEPGQEVIRLPVENRYAFTDLSELTFTWQLGTRNGDLRIALPPRTSGEIEIPIPRDNVAGQELLLTVRDAQDRVVNVLAVRLGSGEPVRLSGATAGPPQFCRDGDRVTVQGEDFSLVFDTAHGDFDATNPNHRAPVVQFPVPHVTQYDFGDLAGPHGKPYAVYPDTKTRVVEQVTIEAIAQGLELRSARPL